jgi:hypothetical protein
MIERQILHANLPPLAAARRFDGLTLREARTRFFAEQGIAPDGGYSAKVVPIYFGKLHFFDMPNTEARLRAVRYHDLHHVLTGYPTNWSGEGRISAWEIATGCRDFWAAWYLNLGGILIGMATDPVGTVQAFVRGLRSQNLYGRPWEDSLLETPATQMRLALGLEQEGEKPNIGELLRFGAWFLVSLAFAGVQLAPWLLLLTWVIHRL